MNTPLTRSRTVAVAAVLLLTLALAAPAGAGAPQRRAQFGTRVEVLQIQVRVADGSGNFVTGLTAADFSIKVDGKDRNITTVYEVDLNENLATSPSVADAGPPPPAAWRQFLLFFDAGFNSPRGVREAQQAALTFIEEQVRPSDLVGVATYNITGMRLLLPFTTDRRQVLETLGGLGLRQAVGNIDRAGFMAETMTDAYTFDEASASGNSGFAAGAIEEAIAQVSRLEDQQYASVAAQYSEHLGILGEYLQAARGTKHVVMFSKGFADALISGASLDDMAAMSNAMDSAAGAGEAIASLGDGNFGSADVRSALEDSLQIMRAAGAVIHVIDPSGLGGERDAGLSRGGRGGGTFSSAGATRSALSMLADGTDGTVSWNTNEPATALATIEESTRQFYVLAFPRQRGDDDVLDLEVSVERSGVEMVSAPGSLAPPPAYDDMSDEQKQVQLAEFISKGIVESDMQFEATAAPFFGKGNTSRVGTVVEVPWGQLEELAKSRGDGKVTFDIFGYVLDDNGAMADMSNNQVTLDIDKLGKGNAKGLPFRYYDLLWAKPGANEVRVLIRENELGRISAVTKQLATPRYAGGPLVVTGPIAMDEEHHGLIMEGIDPENPPEHKIGGPVAYPYVFKDIRWTPATHAEAVAGDTQQLFVALHNMSRHPLTGQAQPPSISLHLFDGTGQELQLADVQLIDQGPDASGGLQMVLGAVLPQDLQEGFYILRFKAEDAISSTTIEQDVELWVIDE